MSNNTKYQDTKKSEDKEMENVKPIDEIFNEREDFILVGFTGRTGAGCTSAAQILQTPLFEDLKLHTPKRTDYPNNEDRKYEIIYDYAKYHWNAFKVISMSDVIISFIVQDGYDSLVTLVENVLGFERELFNESSIDNVAFDEYFNGLSDEFKKCTEYNNDYSYGMLKRPSAEKNIAADEIKCLEKISKVRAALKENLSSKIFDSKNHENPKANAYTYFLQTVGNNLRISGKTDSKAFSGKHMSILARRANGFVKAYRSKNRIIGEKTLLCIDAIRNPYEATYFQDRYNAFYLVAINTDDEERKRRLRFHSGLSDMQIQNLDNREYPSKLKGYDVFTGIDIGACCELGDIHINNPYDRSLDKYQLTEQLVKYITLMKHPGLITPSAVERCMQIAYNAKLNSGCLSRQVGAVITDASYSVKAVGWNSVPEHQVPCNLRSINNYINNLDQDAFSMFEIQNTDFKNALKSKYDAIIEAAEQMNHQKGIDSNSKFDLIAAMGGRHFHYCFKDIYQKANQVHTRSLHAEENAFLQLSKYGGLGIKGGNLFTTASSCVLCSKKAYHLGIKNIYYIIPYPDIAQSHIISFGKQDNVHNPKNILFSGAIGRAYTCLYTQRIALKDELAYLVPPTKSKNGDIVKKLKDIAELFEKDKVNEAWEEFDKLKDKKSTDNKND